MIASSPHNAETSNTAAPADQARDRLFQWIGVLGGPTAWGLQIILGYGITGWSCQVNSYTPLVVLAVVCALGAIGAGVMAFGQWRAASRDGIAVGDLDAPDRRGIFMGSLGVLLNILFVLLIVLTGIANVLGGPCAILTMPIP